LDVLGHSSDNAPDIKAPISGCNPVLQCGALFGADLVSW
jgi:hypothetical protein